MLEQALVGTEVTTEAELLPYPVGSIRDILIAVFKHKIMIVVAFTVIFLGIASWVYMTETLYEASTSIILKFGREHIFRPEVGKADQIVQFNQGAAIESEQRIIQSRDLIRRVVKALGVHALYPELLEASPLATEDERIETATSIFLGSLEAFSTQGSNVIKITFLHQQPAMAAQALNVLVEFLKERHLQIFSDPKASFLIDRLKDYEHELKNAQNNLQTFKTDNHLSSPLDAQQARILDQRAQLDTNYKTIKTQLQGLESKIVSLENQMKTVPKEISLSTTDVAGVLAKARADLFDLQRQKQVLMTKYIPSSVPVQNLQHEIEAVEQFIKLQEASVQDQRVTRGTNPIFQKLELARFNALSEVKTFTARSNVIAGQIRELDQKLMNLDGLNEALVELERKRRAAENNYQLYLTKVEEAKVSEEMDRLKMSNISVIQAADIPRRPASRSKMVLLIIGAVASFIVSIALALISEYLEGTYTRPDLASDDLDLPVLASFGQKR
ncbi:MAG: hypothetical protein NPIRA05_02250 [Nitrospirales bacterium]|nr:MAG: hypothetical protein NPIRA05_02250 [Nitrospirales bacterium]